jgi:hypothetical protein
LSLYFHQQNLTLLWQQPIPCQDHVLLHIGLKIKNKNSDVFSCHRHNANPFRSNGHKFIHRHRFEALSVWSAWMMLEASTSTYLHQGRTLGGGVTPPMFCEIYLKSRSRNLYGTKKVGPAKIWKTLSFCVEKKK